MSQEGSGRGQEGSGPGGGLGRREGRAEGVAGGRRREYFKGAVKQRALQARLRATRYQPGDEYPTMEIQRELAYLADRVYFGRSGLKGVTGNGLWAGEVVEEGEVILVYTGPVTDNIGGAYVLEVWEDGPNVDGTPRLMHPLSKAGYANDPIWLGKQVNARFTDCGLVAIKRIRKGEEIFIDYDADYNWDWLKLAYLPTLVTRIRSACKHYDILPLPGLEDWVTEYTDLDAMRRGEGVALLLSHFLDYRPVARDARMLVVGDHLPRQLGKEATADPDWLEQLLTSAPFAEAFGFWGRCREWILTDEDMALTLPIRKVVLSVYSARPRAVPTSYSDASGASRMKELPAAWEPRYGVSNATGDPSAPVIENMMEAIFDGDQVGDHEAPSEDHIEEDQLDDYTLADLTVVSINMNGASGDAHKELCRRMKSVAADIGILVDTRAVHGKRVLEDAVLHMLGSRYRVWAHVDEAVKRESLMQRVGGVAFVVGPRVTKVKLDRLCKQGSTASISCSLGSAKLFLMATYWPQENNDPGTLWTRIKAHSGLDPIRYLKRLATEALAAARAEGRVVVMAGDLNSDVNTTDKYSVKDFMEEADLVQSGTPAKTALPSYLSKDGLGRQVKTRLDYQLRGDGGSVTSDSFPVLYDTKNTGLHLAVVGRYTLPAGAVNPVSKALPVWRAPEIRLRQEHKVAKVKAILEKVHIPSGSPCDRLEKMTSAVVKAVAKVCKVKAKPKPDGWSPYTRSIYLALDKVLLMLRHCRGSRKKSLWTEASFKAGKSAVLAAWREDARHLAGEDGDENLMRNPPKAAFGYDFWVGKSLLEVKAVAEDAFYSLRRLLHGRKRSDARIEFGGFMALLEKERKEGRLRKACSALIGRKKMQGFSLDSVVHEGVTVTDPAEVARLLTTHFHEWFARKPGHFRGGIEGEMASWRQMEEPLEDFQRRYGHHNIPQDLLEKIWKALQRKTDKVYDSAVVCPTYAEYCSAIEHLPKDSAPGISGLSYNMLRIIPEHLSKAMYDSMAEIWADKLIPDFWKWRWILPIPKEANPTLNDLRPLSLFETTRKVWFALILTKLRAAWARDELLHPAQTMFIKGRSMDMSVISLLNVLETAREMKSDVFLSSWDITKAFDRVPIQAQVWAYIRLGVPVEVAEYMVAFDVDCVAVVRTPLACQAWQTGGYEGLRRHGYSPGVGMAQGNVDSTDKWAAYFDPLLCALDMVDEGHFYFQGGGASASQAKDTAAADDLVSFAGTHEALQAKADIVSAFCLIFGLEVAVQKKLRCFHLKWCADDPLVPDHIVIHLAGWRPHSVPLQNDGLMKHLGVRWDMSLHNVTQEMLATEQLSLAVARLATMPCTMDLKKAVLEGSVFQSLVFHLKFAPWTLDRFHKLDRIVSKALRRILQLDAHYPAELLYLGLGEGGMGCVRLSDLVHTRKLSLIARCDRIGSEARGLMSSMLHRGLHATTGAPPRGYGGHIEIPVVTEDAPATWVTSLVEWLGYTKWSCT